MRRTGKLRDDSVFAPASPNRQIQNKHKKYPVQKDNQAHKVMENCI